MVLPDGCRPAPPRRDADRIGDGVPGAVPREGALMSTTANEPDDSTVSTDAAEGWLGAERATRTAHRRAVTHQAASVLLGYPGERFFERLPLVARAVAELPVSPVRTALLEFCRHASSTPEPELCQHHADVFGSHRHRSLRVACSYAARSEEGAEPGADPELLAEVEAVYAETGWRVSDDESPDHLAEILAFAAYGDADAGQELLVRLSPGLRMLTEALRACDTPYALVVEAIHMTLPSQFRGGESVPPLPAQASSPEDVAAGRYGAGAASSGTDGVAAGGRVEAGEQPG